MKKKALFIIPLVLLMFGCDKKRTTKDTKPTTSKTITNSKTTSDKTNTNPDVDNKTIYVSNDGLDSNDGLSMLNPTSLANAFEIMNSGDTIHLITGTYELEEKINIDISGSEIKRNTLECEDDVIFDFNKAKLDDISSNSGINLIGSYWQINGLTVINADDYGITVTGKGNKLFNCTSKDNYGGFIIDASLTTVTNCIAENNYITAFSAYGFSIRGKGDNNVFEGCLSIDNQDSGYFINATKKTTFNKCLAINNGLKGDSASTQRSGFVFNNKDHVFSNCIAYNNALYGFFVPLTYTEKGSFKLVNCSSINNHTKNFKLTVNNLDLVELENVLSFNNYDGNSDGTIDASNDYIVGKVKNSILFYNKGYFYVKDDQNYNSQDTSRTPLDLSGYENPFIINLEIPEEMKEYLDLERKSEIDAQAAIDGVEPDYSELEYIVNYYKDGVLNIYDYLDRSELFQTELFEKQSITNPTLFGAEVNEKTDDN